MFKKLRNRFLIINAIAIISVLTISFFAIFLITLGNVKKDVSIQLEKTFVDREKPIFDNNKNPLEDPPMNVDESKKFTPPAISFWIELNKSKEIIKINSSNFNNITNDISIELLDKAISKNNNYSYFKYNESYFAYQLLKTDIGFKIAFVDITNNVSVLISFIYAFLFVACISSIVILIFSKHAADKVIRPIKESFEKQKRFISDASHELKTPLTIINTNIDLVLTSKNDTIKKQEKWLNYIKTEGNRMGKLINDLLYLSKMDYSTTTTTHNKFNLSENIENSILPMEAIIFEKKLKLSYNITPNLFITGNQEQIKQVILIIMDNAIKYSDESVKINVNLLKENKKAILTIENTGCGIAKEHIDKIFDRFYRTDESRNKKTGGYGLGLAIAKNIIEEHKGEIRITSIENKKTKVIISFIVTN